MKENQIESFAGALAEIVSGWSKGGTAYQEWATNPEKLKKVAGACFVPGHNWLWDEKGADLTLVTNVGAGQIKFVGGNNPVIVADLLKAGLTHAHPDSVLVLEGFDDFILGNEYKAGAYVEGKPVSVSWLETFTGEQIMETIYHACKASKTTIVACKGGPEVWVK